VAGIYHGPGKPGDVNQFLFAFKEEVTDLCRSGIQYKGKTVYISISGISCDAPATAFLLNIKNHNAFYGCRKCTTRGTWSANINTKTNSKSGGRVVYPELNAQLRTDSAFRDRVNRLHHQKDGRTSIIEEIVVDLVNDVHLDYMHLVCIGSYKKLLKVFFSHPFDNIRLTKKQLSDISAFRIHIQKYIPSEFARKPRAVKDVSRWKATELRLDLLYLCPVVYKKFLTKSSYDHLMLLHAAIRLLLDNDNCRNDADYADNLLRLFVRVSSSLYGLQFASFNIHGLIHLAETVRNHGSLEETSAFLFENELQILKNKVRQCGRALEQIVRRIDEESKTKVLIMSSRDFDVNDPVLLRQVHTFGPILPEFKSAKQFKKLFKGKVILSNSVPDNCVILSGDVYFLIKNIVQLNRQVYVIGRRYLNVESFFDYPLASSNVCEFVVSNLSPSLEFHPFSCVLYKCVRVPVSFPGNGFFFVSRMLNHKINNCK
jgi:hypothetical protein